MTKRKKVCIQLFDKLCNQIVLYQIYNIYTKYQQTDDVAISEAIRRVESELKIEESKKKKVTDETVDLIIFFSVSVLGLAVAYAYFFHGGIMKR